MNQPDKLAPVADHTDATSSKRIFWDGKGREESARYPERALKPRIVAHVLPDGHQV